uniref:Uncharacterized protein n=1 Tax=Tetradesmus obliquus TaxID=3088 RepID=A0A383VW58_TETOB
MVCASFAKGMSLDLQPSTAQDQEFRLALWLGRTLALPSDEPCSCKRHVEYKDATGRIPQLQVDLAFPANSRTITRLMDAWWDCKGGRPPGSSKKAAAALAGTSKPQFKAMTVSFNNAVEKVLSLEAELLSALKDINVQQLALKESGDPLWFHPSRLTSEAQFATTSAVFRARQAAQALLATAQHLYLGSRQAETARGTWEHSSVPGLPAEPPVWVLGLSGLLAHFQATLGTGFSAAYYHCMGNMDFGMPEYHDILPASCSGLCLASITALAFVVLTYLQPVSPAEPIVKQQRGAGSASSSAASSSGSEGSSSSSSGGENSSNNSRRRGRSSSSSSSIGEASTGTQCTPNNAMGFTLAYGGLQHVASFDEVTPSMVNAALAGAKFLNNSFEQSQRHHRSPSRPDAEAQPS